MSVLLCCQAVNSYAETVLQHLNRVSTMKPSARRVLDEFELDVTGDDKPEIFLAISEPGMKYGWEWHVYSPEADRDGVRYLGRLVFFPFAFNYDVASREFSIRWVGAPNEIYFSTLRFDENGIHLLRSKSAVEKGSDEFFSEMERFEQWYPGDHVVMLASPSEGLLRKGRPVWRVLGSAADSAPRVPSGTPLDKLRVLSSVGDDVR